MTGIINNLIDGMFAITIVILFTLYVASRIRKETFGQTFAWMTSFLDSPPNVPKLKNDKEVGIEQWRQTRRTII